MMRISAVVLAAGTSSRMGRPKQLLPIGDEPAIRRTVGALLASSPEEVVVVTGCEGRAVMAALADLPVRVQPNPRYAEGQMTSAAAGVGALSRPCDAVMVCLGDQVLLTADDYRELAAAYVAMPDGRSILVPHHAGARGNPVLFPAGFVPEVVSGRRNPGCRKLIADHPDEVFAYEAAHDRFTTDMDTPEDYARILARLGLGEGLST